jgi:hypothetical protein
MKQPTFVYPNPDSSASADPEEVAGRDFWHLTPNPSGLTGFKLALL